MVFSSPVADEGLPVKIRRELLGGAVAWMSLPGGLGNADRYLECRKYGHVTFAWELL